jgi:hypothetical protein
MQRNGLLLSTNMQKTVIMADCQWLIFYQTDFIDQYLRTEGPIYILDYTAAGANVRLKTPRWSEKAGLPDTKLFRHHFDWSTPAPEERLRPRQVGEQRTRYAKAPGSSS